MAISLRAASSGTAASSATLTPTLPTGWAAGDILVISAEFTGSSSLTFSQTGGTGTWTFHSTGTGNAAAGDTFTTFAAWRVAQSGDTAPTFTSSVAETQSWACIALTPDSGSTISVDVWAADLVVTTVATSFTPNSATAAGAGEASVILTNGRAAAAQTTTSVTYTPPSGWTTPANGSAAVQGGASTHARITAVAYKLGVSGTVAPGAETITDSASGNYAANVYHVLVTETAAPGVLVLPLVVPQAAVMRASDW